MPAIQFSYVPWDYDDETVAISLQMVRLHEEYADLLVTLADEATKTPGFMVNRPIWWLDPDDELALTVDDGQCSHLNIYFLPLRRLASSVNPTISRQTRRAAVVLPII